LGEAERLYRAYLRLAEAPSSEAVEAHNELGNAILRRGGNPAEVLDEHRRALAEARAIGDRDGERQSLFRLGVVHLDIGQAALAEEFYEQALAIARQLGN